MNIPVEQKIETLAFAIEYWTLQREVTRMTGEPLPPCYYCTASRIWNCSKSGDDCTAFRAYCTSEGFETRPKECCVHS